MVSACVMFKYFSFLNLRQLSLYSFDRCCQCFALFKFCNN